MLTSIAWVPAGAMKTVPIRSGIADAKRGGKKGVPQASRAVNDDDDEWADVEEGEEPELEEAEESSDDDQTNPGKVFNQGQSVVDQIESDDEDDVDDTTFRSTDLVFVTTKADQEQPAVDLYIYDDPNDHIYLHHDSPLCGFPLCSSWLSDGRQSLVAVGTMLPFLEVWSLDVVDAIEPIAVLGGCEDPMDNYKKKVRKSRLKQESHRDAIISCDWNVTAQHILASGSSDNTVRLWDLTTLSTIKTIAHQDKVQATRWHPTEAASLLTGDFSGNVSVYDCRTETPTALVQTTVGSTIEKAQWVTSADPTQQATCFVCSSSDGFIGLFDGRNLSAPVWRVQLATQNATFSLSRHIHGLMAVGGKDGHISLFDCRGAAPTELSSRKMGVGEVFGIEFHPNAPYVLGACGSTGRPLVYHVESDVAPMVQQVAQA